ncbi:MAG: DUF3472 domain-containing protein [Pirellulaceae bacterium]
MRHILLTFVLVLPAVPLMAAELRVPAFTAYTLPDAEGARISERSGVTHWTDPTVNVNWYGHFQQTGDVAVKIELRLAKDVESKLQLTLAGQSRQLIVQGAGPDSLTMADFGTFTIREAGYERFTLESRNEVGQPFGDIDALWLDGAALEDARFNLQSRRNAASVHLSYPTPVDTNVTAFYCEVTAVEDPTATFYMACGWHRGYFGMQVNSPTERRIIFSVWDSGNEAEDRNKVSPENRVQLVSKGEGVFSSDFGNEGTGGHSHLKYMWKSGEKQRFVVTAQPTEETYTIFSGYYFHPDKQAWMLISSWKTPQEGGWLRHLHSFSENFGGSNGHFLRKARFGNQWIRTDAGQWIELTTASFSHDATGKADRLDRFMGVEEGQFFLSHGGFVEGFTQYGEKFSRPATDQAPAGIVLPPLPEPPVRPNRTLGASSDQPTKAPYTDGRPGAALRMDAHDQGIVLPYGDGPEGCDQLGAREAIVFASQGTYFLHYDGAGPRGWRACLATSDDLVHWTKKGPILDFGAPGEPDSACVCAPWVHFDGNVWHMFYVATSLATPAPEFIPAVPYLTCKARSTAPDGPWVKQKEVVPFRPQPGTYYSETASAGDIVKQGDQYLMFFSAAAGPPFRRTLGIARTADLDGPWQIDPQPIVPLEEQIENSSLYYEPANKTWFLFTNHVGIDARGEYTDGVWVYWSQDLNRWTARDKAVVLDYRNCGWSPDCLGMPTVVRFEDRLALLYDGPGGTSVSHVRRSIGLAWLALPLVPPDQEGESDAE